MNLLQLVERFPDDEACRKHLVETRWPDGVICPRCECKRVSELPRRKQWTCLGCRYRFSATAGTIFHKTRIPLRKWFMAIWIILNAKKAISSLEVNRQLGISQECCWHMCHRIREMMREEGDAAFSGIVQMDEHFTGGPPRKPARQKPRYKIGGGRKRGRTGRGTTRPIVVGAVETSTGRVRTEHVEDVRKETMVWFGQKHLDVQNVDLWTDFLRSYIALGEQCRSHSSVDHSVEYVTADGVHTNAAENAWSLFSRALIGAYHKISKKHLHRYLDEFDARFNARKTPIGDVFDTVLQRSDGRRLSHASLVG